MKLQDILHLIRETEGDTGIRRFYDDVCRTTPDLLKQLGAHNMLLRARLDLDEKVVRWFGELHPPAQENQV